MIEGIEAIAHIGLNQLERLTKGLPEEQLIETMPGVQLVQWIMTYESYILHVAFLRVLIRDRGYKPEGRPDYYVEK